MSASSLYPYIVPAMQYFAAIVYSGVAQNWVGAGYVGAGVVLYGLTWLVWLIASSLKWGWLGETEDYLQFTANAFSTGSLTAFAVYWALFMWEQYGNNKGTTMGVGIGVGYALTIGMIFMSVSDFMGFEGNNLALIGLMVLLGTGIAVGAYYATKAVEPNQNLYANPSSLTFLLAAILTPAVLGVSAMLYQVSSGTGSGDIRSTTFNKYRNVAEANYNDGRNTEGVQDILSSSAAAIDQNVEGESGAEGATEAQFNGIRASRAPGRNKPLIEGRSDYAGQSGIAKYLANPQPSAVGDAAGNTLGSITQKPISSSVGLRNKPFYPNVAENMSPGSSSAPSAPKKPASRMQKLSPKQGPAQNSQNTNVPPASTPEQTGIFAMNN